jgi:hypothetical protein
MLWLALTLFVPFVHADNPHNAFTLDDFAITTSFFY